MSGTVISRLLVCLLCASAAIEAAEDDAKAKQWFMRFHYQPAWILPTTEFFEGRNETGSPIGPGTAFKLELGWQTDGSADWERRYRLPAFGLGAYRASFRNGDELGAPAAVYGWLSWPVFSLSERVELTAELGLGAAFGFRPFDPESNPFNDAVSTRATFYADAGVALRIALAREWALELGGTFTHFSNGGMGDPNDALNTLSPRVGIRYGRRPDQPSGVLPPFAKFWVLSLSGGSGFKNVNVASPKDPPERRNFGVGAVSVELGRRLYSLGALGGGVDVTYDGSRDVPGGSETWAVGLFGGYRQVIGPVSIPLQIGYDMGRGGGDQAIPALYQKIGLDLHVTDRLYIGLVTRFFDFSRADFVTWVVGYDVSRWF